MMRRDVFKEIRITVEKINLSLAHDLPGVNFHCRVLVSDAVQF